MLIFNNNALKKTLQKHIKSYTKHYKNTSNSHIILFLQKITFSLKDDLSISLLITKQTYPVKNL